MFPKFTSILATGLLASSALAAPPRPGPGGPGGPGRPGPGGPGGKPGSIKNFIYIVPDGYGQASQAMARDFTLLNNPNSTIDAPIGIEYGADKFVSRNLLRPL
jgi:hypothetical protein